MEPIDTASVLVRYERTLKKYQRNKLRISPLAGKIIESQLEDVYIYFPIGSLIRLADSRKKWDETKILLLLSNTA